MSPLTLSHIEWLKTRRRIAFWLALAGFFGLLLLGLGIDYYRHVSLGRGYNGQPGWPELVSYIEGIGLLIMLVTVVLLAAGEKTWRTERQNVIDGLSRTQYFLGKVIVVIAFAALLWIGTLIIGSVFEMLNRSAGEPREPLFLTGMHARLLGGALLYLIMVGAIGLFFGTISSSSGAALALAVLFMFAQTPIIGQMTDTGGRWAAAATYMPSPVLSSLVSIVAYDAERLAAMTERALARGVLVMPSAGRATVAALIYSALLAAGAWFSISRRDL